MQGSTQELQSGTELICQHTGERFEIVTTTDETVEIDKALVTVEWDRSELEADIRAGNFEVRQ